MLVSFAIDKFTVVFYDGNALTVGRLFDDIFENVFGGVVDSGAFGGVIDAGGVFFIHMDLRGWSPPPHVFSLAIFRKSSKQRLKDIDNIFALSYC